MLIGILAGELINIEVANSLICQLLLNRIFMMPTVTDRTQLTDSNQLTQAKISIPKPKLSEVRQTHPNVPEARCSQTNGINFRLHDS